MLSARYNWFDQPASSAPLTCACGWSGTWGDLDMEPFEALMELSCPGCSVHTLVLYPTPDEVRAAAAIGNPEAIQMMEGVEQRERRSVHPLLSQPEDLPDLPPNAPRTIVVTQDDDSSDPDGPWLVVTVGSDLLWRQPSFWEGTSRGETLLNTLWLRYGPDIDEITLAGQAHLYMCGDSLTAVKRIDAALSGHPSK